jgi:hypothetical protein
MQEMMKKLCVQEKNEEELSKMDKSIADMEIMDTSSIQDID